MASPQLEEGYTRIANELFDSIISFDFGKIEQKIVFYIIRRTYGYQEKTARIKQSEISKATNLGKANISKTLDLLIKRKVLFYETGSGNLGLNKNYEEWEKVVKTTTFKHEKEAPEVVKTTTKSCQNNNPELLKQQQKVVKTTTTYKVLKKKENSKRKKKNISKTAASQKTDALVPVQTKLWEIFKQIYEKETGQPLDPQVKDFKILHDLSKEHGEEAVINKMRILYVGCKKAVFWFTKSGFSDFTIGKLKQRWNDLVPIETPEQRKQREKQEKDLEFAKQLAEERKQNETK